MQTHLKRLDTLKSKQQIAANAVKAMRFSGNANQNQLEAVTAYIVSLENMLYEYAQELESGK